MSFSAHAWGSLYSCQAKNLVIDSQNTTVISIIGKHLSNKTNDDVLQIYIDKQETTYLPKGLQNHFPNIISMVVITSQVKFIRKQDFRGLEKLKQISLGDNEIQTVPQDTFVDLRDLEQIYLYLNHLEEVNSDLFKENFKLKAILLDHNKLRLIGSQIFTHLKNLKNVDLDGNACINKKYPETSFSGLIQEMSNNCRDPLEEIKTLMNSNEQKLNAIIEKLDSRCETIELEIQKLQVENQHLKDENAKLSKALKATA